MKLTDLSLVALSSFSSLIRIPFPVSPTLVPSLCSAVSDSSETLYPWDFPDENTGVGYHFLLQGIFPTQGSNPHLLRLLLRQADFFTTSSSWEARVFLGFSLLHCRPRRCHYRGTMFSGLGPSRLLHEQTTTPVSPSPLCLAHSLTN